jgi:hypothetical protein
LAAKVAVEDNKIRDAMSDNLILNELFVCLDIGEAVLGMHENLRDVTSTWYLDASHLT